jgi:hypothetical protein
VAEGFDLGGLLRQAQELQESMAAARDEAAATVVEGHAGGGVVKIAMTAAGEFRSVSIAPEVVDPDDVEMLEDLVLAALRDATARADEVQGDPSPDLGGIDLGGLDLGSLGLGGLDLGGLLGGGQPGEARQGGAPQEAAPPWGESEGGGSKGSSGSPTES